MAMWMAHNAWLFFLVPGLVLLIAGFLVGLRAANFRATAARTEGTVVQNHYSTDSEGSASYNPEVEFIAHDGKKYTFVSSVGSSPPSFQVGQRVPVLYAPDQPDRGNIDTFGEQWLLPLILCGVGVVFTSVSGLQLLIRR